MTIATITSFSSCLMITKKRMKTIKENSTFILKRKESIFQLQSNNKWRQSKIHKDECLFICKREHQQSKRQHQQQKLRFILPSSLVRHIVLMIVVIVSLYYDCLISIRIIHAFPITQQQRQHQLHISSRSLQQDTSYSLSLPSSIRTTTKRYIMISSFQKSSYSSTTITTTRLSNDNQCQENPKKFSRMLQHFNKFVKRPSSVTTIPCRKQSPKSSLLKKTILSSLLDSSSSIRSSRSLVHRSSLFISSSFQKLLAQKRLLPFIVMIGLYWLFPSSIALAGGGGFGGSKTVSSVPVVPMER